MSEVRTPSGKLVGMVEAATSSFHIKDGKKTTKIGIPADGLRIQFIAPNGAAEDVYIASPRQAQAFT
jgi:hypothetical protein